MNPMGSLLRHEIEMSEVSFAFDMFAHRRLSNALTTYYTVLLIFVLIFVTSQYQTTNEDKKYIKPYDMKSTDLPVVYQTI